MRQNISMKPEVRDLLVTLSDRLGMSRSEVVSTALLQMAETSEGPLHPRHELRAALERASRALGRIDADIGTGASGVSG